MWAYSEGLQRELIVNWTKDQLDYFFQNWRTTGNKEMADYITKIIVECGEWGIDIPLCDEHYNFF
jgi:hypothetical protein